MLRASVATNLISVIEGVTPEGERNGGLTVDRNSIYAEGRLKPNTGQAQDGLQRSGLESIPRGHGARLGRHLAASRSLAPRIHGGERAVIAHARGSSRGDAVDPGKQRGAQLLLTRQPRRLGRRRRGRRGGPLGGRGMPATSAPGETHTHDGHKEPPHPRAPATVPHPPLLPLRTTPPSMRDNSAPTVTISHGE